MDEEEMGDSFKSQEQQVGEAQSLENIAVETGASSESQQLQEASLQNPSISSEIPPAASSPAAVNFNMPFKHPFSNDQLKTLLAMLETFFAQLDEQQQSIVSDKYSSSGISPPLKVQDSEAIQNYLCINKSPPVEYYNKLLVAVVQKLVTSSLPDQLSKLQLLLRFLSNSWGTFLLLGARRVPFYDLSIDEREVGLLKLADSRFEQIRAIFKAFKALTLVVVYGKSSDPMLKGIGYEQEKSDPDAKYIPTFMSGKEIIDVQPGTKKSKKGSVLILETDVVVVGSGCGGGLVAGELAQQGFNVLVLEKGSFYQPETLVNMDEADISASLFESKGALMAEDLGVTVLAGSTWGGGSTVNWSASLRPPAAVREEWASRFDMPYFLSRDYQHALDVVCEKIGVSTSAIEHNTPNSLLIQGCQKLGYPFADIPQNTANKPHKCGWCHAGCPNQTKQSSTVTWLKQAEEHGAKFIKDCHVRRVVHTNGIAQGVAASLTIDGETRRLFVKAKRVVVSCGSINSPALLLRSKLKNPNIGKNLYLHPVTMAFGLFPDTCVKQYNGSIMTAVSPIVQNVHGNGYGALIEVPIFTPGFAGAFSPWKGRVEHKFDMLKYNNKMALIVLTRDKDPGRVWIDKDGNPRVEYSLSQHDQESMIKGLEACVNILIAAGASEIGTVNGVESFSIDPKHPSPLTSPEFIQWKKKMIDVGIQKNRAMIGSAHQMGTCKMSSSPKTGVCSPKGETHEVKGLYVADASLFPTSSGVNPMVTTYSLAYTVAQHIKASLAMQLKTEIDSKL